MTVDISKIRPGDEVHVRLKVRFVETSYVGVEMLNGLDLPSVRAADIVAHIPAPRPLKVGDLVTWYAKLSNLPDATPYMHVGTIRAIDNGVAWAGSDTVLPLDRFTRKG